MSTRENKTAILFESNKLNGTAKHIIDKELSESVNQFESVKKRD